MGGTKCFLWAGGHQKPNLLHQGAAQHAQTNEPVGPGRRWAAFMVVEPPEPQSR